LTPPPGKADGTLPQLELAHGVARHAAEQAAAQYEDYFRTFMALDGKAQAAATVAGVALASVVAFIKPEHLKASVAACGIWGYALVALPGIGALATILLSIRAVRVTEMTIPYAAADQIGETEDLLQLDPAELTGGHLLDFQRARLRHWKKALEDVRKAVEHKAQRVAQAQKALVVTITLLFLMVMVGVMSVR
jgi:hypothetical protein